MTSTTATPRSGSALPAESASSPTPEPQHDVLTEAATAVMLPFALARRLVPDSPVPVALGVGALALAGAIEWPAAAAMALGYLAIRGWRPSISRPA